MTFDSTLDPYKGSLQALFNCGSPRILVSQSSQCGPVSKPTEIGASVLLSVGPTGSPSWSGTPTATCTNGIVTVKATLQGIPLATGTQTCIIGETVTISAFATSGYEAYDFDLTLTGPDPNCGFFNLGGFGPLVASGVFNVPLPNSATTADFELRISGQGTDIIKGLTFNAQSISAPPPNGSLESTDSTSINIPVCQ